MRRWITRLIVLALICGGIGAAWWKLSRHAEAAPESFQTVPLHRGDMLVTISATGTVEPEEVIDVGAQVAGQILSFGTDKNGKTIDYGSAVEAGTVLARIDDSVYSADVAQAQAQLAQAEAGVNRAKADLDQMRAKLVQATRDWERAKRLGPSDALSQSDYDAAEATYEVAKANVAVSEAALVQDQQAILVSEATLKRSKRNLDYCTITSPVKGVIIDRRVNIGQTVVASLNAPSLFLLAKDLKRMQVWVSVNEADIGSVYPGQPVAFTADAYPGQMFHGQVNKVRLNATMTQNVVTYTVEVTTDNSDGKLLPYLTANTKFEVAQRQDVWLVPNAALRWNPSPDQIAPGAESSVERDNATTRPSRAPSTQPVTRGIVWEAEGNLVRAIHVIVGASDGTNTEIRSQQFEDGMQIVIGEKRAESADSASGTNPFLPQMRRPNRPENQRRSP